MNPMLNAVRVRVHYRFRKPDQPDWESAQIIMTLRKDSNIPEQAFRRLYRRLVLARHWELDINVRCEFLGSEAPIAGGEVVNPNEYQERREKLREQFSEKDVRDRARELGIWIPEPVKLSPSEQRAKEEQEEKELGIEVTRPTKVFFDPEKERKHERTEPIAEVLPVESPAGAPSGSERAVRETGGQDGSGSPGERGEDGGPSEAT